MYKSSSTTNTNLLKNTFWILKLSFQHIPLIATARIIGFVNNNVSGLFRAFVVGLVIDWMIKYVDGTHEQLYLIYALFAFGTYYLITSFAGVASN